MVQRDNIKAKHIFLKINIFGYFEIHGFHGNPLSDFKDWEHATKILLSLSHLILEHTICYQINLQKQHFFMMIRYLNDLI